MVKRYKLRKHHNQQMTITGHFIRWSKPGRRNRYMLVVKICNAASDDEICDHAWIPYGFARPDYGLQHGDAIKIRAIVRKYEKGFCFGRATIRAVNGHKEISPCSNP